MEIVIDSREHKVLRSLQQQVPKFKSISLRSQTLDLGDFALFHGGSLLHLIERKTDSDLLASIVDGRYKEQSFRLNEHTLANNSIYYLLETKSLQRDQRLVSCTYSLQQKGFSVFRTSGVDETAFFILCLAAKALKPLKSPARNVATAVPNSNYLSTIKAPKKNTDPRYVTVSLYSQIPRISSVTAQALAEKFPCVEQLLWALRNDKNSITDFRVNNRRLPVATINNLETYLLLASGPLNSNIPDAQKDALHRDGTVAEPVFGGGGLPDDQHVLDTSHAETSGNQLLDSQGAHLQHEPPGPAHQ